MTICEAVAGNLYSICSEHPALSIFCTSWLVHASPRHCCCSLACTTLRPPRSGIRHLLGRAPESSSLFDTLRGKSPHQVTYFMRLAHCVPIRHLLADDPGTGMTESRLLNQAANARLRAS